MQGSLALAVLLLLVASMIINPASASIPKPSVPEFTLEFVDNSYNKPPTTISTINPYNNKTTTTTYPGYYVQNFTIVVTIKNQPYPVTLNGNASNLYYNIRTKGHFAENWSISIYSYTSLSPGNLPTQSSSLYTVLSYPIYYSPGDQVDYQVEAILGYQYSYDEYNYGGYSHLQPIRISYFIYELSNWSLTQTFTMPETSTSTSSSPNPTPSPTTSTTPTASSTPTLSVTPSIPEFPTWISFPLILALVFLVFYKRKRK